MTMDATTKQAFLLALEQDAEFRTEIRRTLLTTELLELPERFAEFVSATNERFNRLETALAQFIELTSQRLTALETDVAELKTDVAELKTDMGTLKTEVGTLTQRVDTMSGTVSRLAGEDYESHVCNYAERILRRQLGIDAAVFATQRHKEPLSKLLNEAEKQGRLLPEEVDDLDEADLTLTSHTPEGYVVVEISITIQQTDVDRATARAALLSKATSQDVTPVVAGTAEAPNLSMRTAQAIFVPERPSPRQTSPTGDT